MKSCNQHRMLILHRRWTRGWAGHDALRAQVLAVELQRQLVPYAKETPCSTNTRHSPDVHASAQVLDFELQQQLVPYMKDMTPLPGIYDPDFIAANQDTRADNVIKGTTKEQLDTIRRDIRTFKEQNQARQLRSTSVPRYGSPFCTVSAFESQISVLD